MIRFMFLCMIGITLLMGCESNDDSKIKTTNEKKSEHQKDKSETKKQITKGNKSSDFKNNKDKVLSGLTEKEKIGLAFYAKNAGKYILTKNEILTNCYEGEGPNGMMKYAINDNFMIEKHQPINSAPIGMKFYTVLPTKNRAASIIGIGYDKIYIGSTQSSFIDYNQALRYGEDVDIYSLYEKYKNHRGLSEITNKIKIYAPHEAVDRFDPMKAKLPLAETINYVYGMINEFEGKSVNTNKYLWDNIRLDNDGNWTVNYRNHDGEIMGTYKSEKDKIIKLDQNGNKVKEKQMSNQSEE